MPWFVLLLITSLLGPYGDGLNVRGPQGYGFAVELGASIVIYLLAYNVRLFPEATARYVAHTHDTRLTSDGTAHPDQAPPDPG